ncbi:MAG: hypothetical protein Q9162_006652 [Coniocarpon cinnabarinum]
MSLTPAQMAALAAIVPGSPQAWQGYEGDETAKQALSPLLGVTISFLILNTLFVLLRFYTSVFLRGKTYRMGWDDWLLIPAWVSTTALCAVVLFIYKQETIGNGPADRPILDYRITPLLKSTYAGVQFLLPGYLFTRLSILVLYLRIFKVKYVRQISWAMIVFVSLQYIAYMIACLLQCYPVPFFWDKMRPGGGKCVDINKFYRSFTPPNMFVDLVLILSPLPTVWRLNASFARRMGYSLCFLTSVIALIASIVRQYELMTNDNEQLYPHASNLIISWLVLEPSLYLVTACMPGMVPLLAVCLPASIRNQHTAPQIRHTRSLSRRPGGVEAGDTGFTRLVDDPHTTSGRAEMVKGLHVRDGSESVPMDDLRRMAEGGGVLVTTEVSVTQEERFVEVLGF